MERLKSCFYNSRLLYADLKLPSFLNQLNHALANNLPLDQVNIPVQDFKRHNHKQFLEQFEYENLIQVEDSFKSIIDYLNKNKYKLSKERKIEIFSLILFWFSVSNLQVWLLYNDVKKYMYGEKTCKIITSNYSFEWLHKFAKTILYEVNSTSCCYNYKQVAGIINGDDLLPSNRNNSVLQQMQTQPDILTRAICSQSTENVQLLLDNGLNLNNFKSYPHPILKSPLHWAYYCDNVDIFNLLIENGLRVEENDGDIFYDVNHKKNFKFSVYLHFLKENNLEICKSLKFDRHQFLTGYKLYENKSNDELINLFDSLFKIGFKLDFLSEIYEKFKKKPDTKPQSYTQLFSCIYQNGISSFLINFLIQKLKNDCNFTNLMVQNELLKGLKTLTYFFYRNVSHRKPKLEANYYLTIISTLLPMFDEIFIKRLKKACYMDTHSLVIQATLSIFFPNRAKFIEGEEECSIYLFKRKMFKIIDLFFQYKLLRAKDHIEVFDALCNMHFVYRFPFDLQMEYIVTYIYYLLENDFMSTKAIIGNFKKVLKFDRIDYTTKLEEFQFVNDTLDDICKTYQSKPRSLFCLSRLAIRNSNNSRIKQNVPKFFVNAIMEHIKPTYKDMEWILNSTAIKSLIAKNGNFLK